MKFYNVFSGALSGTMYDTYVKNLGDNQFNNLHSYWYFKDYNDEKILSAFKMTKGNVMIDSGAFTAYADSEMKKGKKDAKEKHVDINQYIEDYLNWINKWDDYVSLFGQMDRIPMRNNTPEEIDQFCQITWQNYLYMTARMKSPKKLLYTFHFGEDFKWLKQALEYRDQNGDPIDYMAIGGLVGKTTKERIGFLDACFKIIADSSNPHIKVHGFGVSSEKVWRKYPFESCDSFTPGMNTNHGYTYDEFGNYREKDYKKHFTPEDPTKRSKTLLGLETKIDPDFVPETAKSEEQLQQEAYERVNGKTELLVHNIKHWHDLANSIQKPDITKFKSSSSLLGI